jgi:hypothetical protein
MLPMKLRSLIVAVAIALAPFAFQAPLQAQVGLYLNPIAMRISNSTADKGTFSFLGSGSTSRIFYGPEFGGYYDFKTPYPFQAGLDMRDSIMHGNSAFLNNFLVGVRISGKPFNNQLKPYIEPVVGVGTSHAPETTIHVSKLEYGVYAGVDYQTHHHVDFRILELGYGSVTTASSETIGGTAAIPAATIFSLSTGLVFRFP